MSDIRKSSWILVIITILITISLATTSSDIVAADDEVPVVRGDTITISITILQNGTYGNPVRNQRIYYFDETYNTLLGYAISNQNGEASIDWEIPLNHPLGQTVINATFYGNESLSLAPSYQRVSLLILSQTHIEVDYIPGMLAPGDLLSFNVHLIDDLNSSISNCQLTVFKDTTLLTTGITNVSGHVFFEIECNSSWISLGENNIRISFEQDLVNFLNNTESAFTIEITKIQTSLNFESTISNEVELSTTIDLQMTLTEGNHTLPGEIIEVTLDDDHLSTLITNSSGLANLHTTIDERFTLGIHSLKISYNGTERYLQSTLEVIITVTSPVILDTTVSDPAELGLNVFFEFTLTDLLNRPIPNSILSLQDTSSNQSFSIPIEDDTIIEFQYLLQGPSGIHTLIIEILGNPFVSDNTMTTNFTAWSRPEIMLEGTEIDHYASPNQEISFKIRLTDWNGNCSTRQLQLLVDDEFYTSSTTDNDGFTFFNFLAPFNEAHYNISIVFNGNITRYELTSKYNYDLFVTTFMPITLELNSYEVFAPLNELSVQLTVRGLNGTLLAGVIVNFDWLSQDLTTESTEGGLIVLHLTIPVVSGSYFLFYESEPTKSIDSTQGSVLIEISINDIMSTEGVGITGMVFAVATSIGIVAVPLIRRRYLVG